jgi:hypothetical protein
MCIYPIFHVLLLEAFCGLNILCTVPPIPTLVKVNLKIEYMVYKLMKYQVFA